MAKLGLVHMCNYLITYLPIPPTHRTYTSNLSWRLAPTSHLLVVFLPSRAAAFRTGDLSRPFGLVTAAWEGTPLHSHVDVRARRSLTCPNQLLYIASDLGLRKLGRPPAASSIEGGVGYP